MAFTSLYNPCEKFNTLAIMAITRDITRRSISAVKSVVWGYTVQLFSGVVTVVSWTDIV